MPHITHLHNRIALIAVAAIVLHITLLIVGCATTNLRNPEYVYQDHKNPNLSLDDVAYVWWDVSNRRILSIERIVVDESAKVKRQRQKLYDRRKGPTYYGAELLPDKYEMVIRWKDSKTAPKVQTRINADLTPGHSYAFKIHNVGGFRPRDYAVSLIDEKSGALVAGRSPEVLRWTWTEWEQALQRMKISSATESQIIELLSEQFDRLQGNTLVYIACPEVDAINTDMFVAERRKNGSCGFLFLEFDKHDVFHSYTYIPVPFRECHVNFFVALTSSVGRTSSGETVIACRARIKKQGYAMFRASSMKH